jgi:hypothetical protein
MCQRLRFSLLGCLIGVLVLGLTLASCGKKGTQDMARADVSLTDSILVSVELNEGSYAIGEPVVMRLIAGNSTGRNINLTFPTAQRFDFIVRQDKRVIWQWSDEKAFAQVTGRESLRPGDSISYEYKWDQKLPDGTNPDLGAYTIQAMLMTQPTFTSRQKRFGVVD